ncbi:hypothetical protein [Emticicia soli]|uniref:DUF937 domain-containing protein n=1 Tax=Emticicia soli TaxID=2027878 RepID=A0ABW5J5S8_9BACT
MNGLDGGFSSWYFQNMDSFTQMQVQQAQIQASGKDKWWEQLLNGVIKYGDPFLTMLTKNGIIPNKNIQAVIKGQYDQNAMAQLMAANGGSLDKAPAQIIDRSANNKIFGLDTSTLVLIAAAILLFMVGKKQ